MLDHPEEPESEELQFDIGHLPCLTAALRPLGTPVGVGSHAVQQGLGSLHLGQVNLLVQPPALTPGGGLAVAVQVAVRQGQQLPQRVVGVVHAHALQQLAQHLL